MRYRVRDVKRNRVPLFLIVAPYNPARKAVIVLPMMGETA
jgi:hypothetical protein